MKKTTNPSTAKKSEYTANLIVLGKKYSAKGKTISSAIDGLKIGVARGKAVLTISTKEKSKERILNHLQTARLFNTRGLSREVILKNVSSLFEGI